MVRINKEIYCACGCGQKLLEYDKRGRKRLYINGHACRGIKVSEETRKKQSDAKKDKYLGDKNPFFGKKHTTTTKNKISEANTGKKRTENVKQKLSESHKGDKHWSWGKQLSNKHKRHLSESLKGKNAGTKHPNYGKKMSNEQKKKLSEAHTGKNHTKEAKKKISDGNKGKILSNETRRKISDGNKGKKLTQEHKQKIGDAHRGEKSYMWKGGVSFEPYCPKFNNIFKEKIRDKFDRKCFLCGLNELDNNKKLSIHHVQYNKNCGCDDALRCDYVPLCVSCHSKTNHNRNKWEKSISQKLQRLSL